MQLANGVGQYLSTSSFKLTLFLPEWRHLGLYACIDFSETTDQEKNWKRLWTFFKYLFRMLCNYMIIISSLADLRRGWRRFFDLVGHKLYYNGKNGSIIRQVGCNFRLLLFAIVVSLFTYCVINVICGLGRNWSWSKATSIFWILLYNLTCTLKI